MAVNIWFFAYPAPLVDGGREIPIGSAADAFTAFLVTLLFEGKAYMVFAFLFGLSFTWQWASAERAGESVVAWSLRRSLVLAVLGVIHGLLLFVGDVLLAYAVLGALLLGLRRLSTRAALLLAALLYLVTVVLMAGAAGSEMLHEPSGGGADGSGRAGGLGGLGSDSDDGGLAGYLAAQWRDYPAVAASVLFGQGPLALAGFLIGLVVGRSGILPRILAGEVPMTRLLGLMTVGLGLGLGLSAAAAMRQLMSADADVGVSGGADPLVTTLILAAGPLQATGYVLAGLLLLRAAAAAPVVRVVAPAGRMSLTNYLTQSLVLALVFSRVGLDLGGGFGSALPAWVVGLLALTLWSGQVVFSLLWMRVFSTGPVEGLVRAVTYRRRPAWR